MGKTSKPLKILCVGVWGDAFTKLQEQGHEVRASYDEDHLADYDLIMGPTCWRLLPEHMKYLSLALKEARAVKPKKVPRAQG